MVFSVVSLVLIIAKQCITISKMELKLEDLRFWYNMKLSECCALEDEVELLRKKLMKKKS